MMCKFLLALGLCLCLGQLGEGTMGMRDMRQYLASYHYLGGLNYEQVMVHVKTAVERDYLSRGFQVLKLYDRFSLSTDIMSAHEIFIVKSIFQELNACVEARNLSRDCLEIVQEDKCNIKRKYIITKEQFYAKVAQALQTPGFDAVPGLVQDVQTLQAMVTEMNLDSEITDLQTFDAFVKNDHEMTLFVNTIEFSRQLVVSRMP